MLSQPIMAALLISSGFFAAFQSSPNHVTDSFFSGSASGGFFMGIPRWDGRDITLVSGTPQIEVTSRILPINRRINTISRRACGFGSCENELSKICVIDLDKNSRGKCCLDP
jgi:hypothetical protein